MGAEESSMSHLVEQPDDITSFRKLGASTVQFAIPEVPEKRKKTDFKFTIVLGSCLLVLLPFLIYTFIYSDLNRFSRGYDMCGNVCGKNNSGVDGIDCSGQDKTNLPLLKYKYVTSQSIFEYRDPSWEYDCADSCNSDDYTIVMNRCFPGSDKKAEFSFIAEIAADINRGAGYIVALCFIGFGLSVGMLFLFRYFVAVVVWVILIGSIIGMIIFALVFWVLYSNNTTESDVQGQQTLQCFVIFFSVITIGLVLVLVFMVRRIQLVIRMFKEAIKVIFEIPVILFEPLLTLLASSILIIIFVFFWVIFGTAGVLEHVENGYGYVPNTVMVFTMFFHSVMCLWMLKFVIGCQHMVISGAVSAYYFARDKTTLTSPIYNSFYILIKYHLGTVAFGSFILTIIAIVRALIRILAKTKHIKVLIACCLAALEESLKFISKNAYIQTAMHGQPFCKSGKRAVRLLVANLGNTIAINSVGDFVLNMAKLFIVICTVGIATLIVDPTIKYYWVIISIGAFVTAIIADCFFSVFETAVDTIFLCFCEDSCMNDGVQQPYYMTTEFMQYMEDARKSSEIRL